MLLPVGLYTVEVFGSDCALWFPWVHGQKAFHTYTTCSMYVAPLIFIFILYFKIWKAISTSGINPATSTTKGKQSKLAARKKRTLRLIVFTVVTYALAWAPTQGLVMLVVWDENTKGLSSVFTTGKYFTYLFLVVNSSINPCIYSFAGKGFIRHIFFWRDGNQNKPRKRNIKNDRHNHNQGATERNVPLDAAVSCDSLSISMARPSTIASNLATSYRE